MASALEFASIHARFRPRVLRYLSRLVGAADAEDVAQAVMLKVSEGLGDFRGDSELSTWIYRIATNAAFDKLRHKVLPVSDAPLDPEDGEVPPQAQVRSVEAAALRGEMSACIHEFVERLPPGYRTVMVLGELEGFGNAEIAAILGVSLDTVKIRLHRARARLRAELQAGCTFYRDDCQELACDRRPPAPLRFRPRS